MRPYEAGDPLNRIHWRATARTGPLHSKVYEPSTVAGATILLEFHRAAYGGEQELSLGAGGDGQRLRWPTPSTRWASRRAGDQRPRCRRSDSAGRVGLDPRTRDAARRAASMIDTSDRLAPVVVPTEHGPEQLMRILETLARVELTDGLTFAQLVYETASRLPRDATVVALVPSVSTETAVALGSVRRRRVCRDGDRECLPHSRIREGRRAFGGRRGRGPASPRQRRHPGHVPELCAVVNFS